MAKQQVMLPHSKSSWKGVRLQRAREKESEGKQVCQSCLSHRWNADQQSLMNESMNEIYL